MDGSVKIGVSLETQKFLSDITGMGAAAKSGLSKLEDAISSSVSTVNRLETKYKELTQSVENTKEKLTQQAKAISEATARYGANSAEVAKLNAEYKQTATALRAMEAELEQTNKEINQQGEFLSTAMSSWVAFKTKMSDVSNEMKKLSETLNTIGKAVTDVGKKMTLGITTPLVALGTLAAKSAIDFESAFAGVKKTTDETVNTSFAQLKQGILDMSAELPQSAAEIAGVAEMAGQLGVSADDILGFTRVMIDMGESTNLSATDAAVSIARFANITGMAIGDASKLGSVIVELGNNFATTEAEIMSMTMRIAGAGTTAGLTEAQMVAFATALSSVGIEAEMGGTAISTVINGMTSAVEVGGDKLEAFAKVAGMSAEQFKRAFKEDASSALLAFITGLGNAGEVGDSVIAMIDDMGMGGARLKDVLLRASNSSDLFAGALNKANDAWDKGAALSDEAAQRYATLESRMKMVRNQVQNLGMSFGELLMPYIEKALTAITNLVAKFMNLDEGAKKAIITFAAIAAAIGPIVIIIGTLISIAGTVVGAISAITGAIAIMGTGAVGSTVAINVLAGAFMFLSSSAFLIPAAIIAVSVAIAKFTPVGDAAYVVLVALAAAFVTVRAAAGIQAAILALAAAFGIQNAAINAATISAIAHAAAAKVVAAGQAIAAAATALFSGSMFSSIAATVAATGAVSIFGVTLSAAIWPITLIVAAIAALAAGVIFLVSVLNRQSEAVKETVKEVAALKDKQVELTESIQNANQQYDENFAAMRTQSQATRSLAGEIDGLAQSYQSSGEGMGLLQAKVDRLNESVPGLNLVINEETGALNMSTEAIYEKIAAQEAELELNAQLAEQQRLKQDEIRIETELQEIQKKSFELQVQRNEKDKMSRADKKALQEATKELSEAERGYGAELEGVKSRQERLNPLIAENAEKVRETKKANEEAAEAMKASEEQIKAMEKAVEGFSKTATNGFKEIKGAQEALADSTEQKQSEIRNSFIKTQEVQTKMTEQFAAAISEINGLGFDSRFVDDLVAEYGTGTAEALAIVKAWAKATPDEVEKVNQNYVTGAEAGVHAMAAVYGGSTEVPDAASNMIDQAAVKVKDNKNLTNAAIAQVTEAKTAMANQVKSSDFQSVGADMGSGVAIGLEKKKAEIIATARSAISGALSAMRAEADSHSPSKKTIALGNDIGDGLIIGAEEKQSEVAEAGGALAQSFIGSLVEPIDAGLADAKEIMLGEWTDINQGLLEITKSSGADRIQAEINRLDETIAAIEKKNAEIAKAEEKAQKERAIKEAKDDEARVKAQEELNKLIAKNELEALKERRDRLNEQLKQIADAYSAMCAGIVQALKESYEEQRNLSKDALSDEISRRKDALDTMVSAQKDALDTQVENQKEATKAIIEQYEAEYRAKIRSLDWSESSEVAQLQAQIDSIDEQTEAEERSLKVQENRRKLFDLQQKIDQAESLEERQKAQDKYAEEFRKQAREHELLLRKDEKASLKEKIAQIKAAYAEQKAAAKEQFERQKEQAKEEEAAQLEHLKAQQEALNKSYKEQQDALNKHLQAEIKRVDDHYNALTQKERLEAEARKMMLDGNQKEIVALLNKYVPDWATAGQSSGQAFLNALQGVTPSIQSEVERIMNLVNQASQAQQELSSVNSYSGGGNSSSGTAPQQSQTQSSNLSPPSYTVKSGDTLSSIASKYGVTVDALRNENGLRPEDDKKLQVGKTLRIPILHEGGVSLKEQFALIDKNEAVAPLAALASMMEKAVITTANKLVSGFTRSIKNVTNNQTTNNDNGIQVTVNLNGEVSSQTGYNIGYNAADQIARELRNRGVAYLA